MTENDRTELLGVLSELSAEAGELRFGQMIANVATLARGTEPGAVWDVEDDELLAAARRLLVRYHERKAATA